MLTLIFGCTLSLKRDGISASHSLPGGSFLDFKYRLCSETLFAEAMVTEGTGLFHDRPEGLSIHLDRGGGGGGGLSSQSEETSAESQEQHDRREPQHGQL